MSRLDLIAGPNGAGKSTFAELILLPSLPAGTPFINADIIAAQLCPSDPAAAAYDASKAAATARGALLTAGRSFATETVFSHPSKLDLVRDAHAAGYIVSLYVLMVPEEVSVRRVAARVAAGGHAVPEDKIRGRYRRLWTQIVRACRVADRTSFWDNSNPIRPTAVAMYNEGRPIGATAWPEWTPAVLLELDPA